jgi:hypothetical protein
MATVIPFALSNSADDAEPEVQLSFGASRRRASGQAHLTDAGLQLQLDPPDGRTALVPYAEIGSVVFTPGLMRNRLRLTARHRDGFAAIGAKRPNELVALVGRRHRDGTRDFVAALRLRIAAAVERAAGR